MTEADVTESEATRRLQESRAELAGLMGGDEGEKMFPRSRVMKALTSGNGRLLLVGAALAMTIVSPRLGRRLLALAPLPTIARQALTAWVRQ